MLSRLWILAIGVIAMIVFQFIKFMLSKFAPSFHEKAKSYYSWVILALNFIVFYITYAVKFKNYLPFDSLLDACCVTAIAIMGYDLIEPILKKIFKKS